MAFTAALTRTRTPNNEYYIYIDAAETPKKQPLPDWAIFHEPKIRCFQQQNSEKWVIILYLNYKRWYLWPLICTVFYLGSQVRTTSVVCTTADRKIRTCLSVCHCRTHIKKKPIIKIMCGRRMLWLSGVCTPTTPSFCQTIPKQHQRTLLKQRMRNEKRRSKITNIYIIFINM